MLLAQIAAMKPNYKGQSVRKKQPFKRVRPFMLYLAGAFVLTAVLSALVTIAGIVVAYNLHTNNVLSNEDLYRVLFIAAVIALGIAVAIGLIFASGIAFPLENITRTAQAIRNGDLSARTNLHGQDELPQLGQTFDEMADAIERERDLEQQLIGDVAHELRTPLMGMQVTIEGMQDKVLPVDDEHLATLADETKRLGRLVEALLHLNRLENGTINVKQERLDLSDLVSHIVLTQEVLIKNVGLDFASYVEPDIVIIGDRDLMIQTVLNLLSNATRYTQEGGSVSLSLIRSTGNATLAVSDTGIGIAEEDLDKVFSRFWRADEARERKSGGLGIGLALVREVVDQHHGNISVQSRLGEGTTFCVNIPLSEEDEGSRLFAEKSVSRKSARAARKA